MSIREMSIREKTALLCSAVVLLSVLALSGCAWLHLGETCLVKDGKPCADIVISEKPAGEATEPPAKHGEALKLSEVSWDFESGTLEGWTLFSGNLGKQPASKDADWWRHFNKQHGEYFIRTFEDGNKVAADGYKLTGELRSPVFIADAEYLAFLVGGGSDLATTYVALCDAENNSELLKAAGKSEDAMEEVVWDISKFKGQRLYLKVVDKSTNGWGHINFDYARAVTKEYPAQMEREKKQALEQKRKAVEALRLKWAESNADYAKHARDPLPRKVYSGKDLAICQMPAGGIGAGGFAICGDGVFRRWMTHSDPHVPVPDAFFAIRAKAGEKAVARMLRLGQNGVQNIDFRGEYPVAFHAFKDDALPVIVQMESFSPFIPLNEKDSALPLAFFIITVENTGREKVSISLVGALRNIAGQLGETYGGRQNVDSEDYGGNVNTPFKCGRFTGVLMTRKDANHPGSLALVAADASAQTIESWTDYGTFWTAVSNGNLKVATAPDEPSPAGKTVNGAVDVSFSLAPGEKREVPFVWAWHLPGSSCATHMYENWFTDASDACKYADANWERLVRDTRLFHDTFFDSTLPFYVLDRVSSQCSTLSTRVVNWTKSDNFYGWEGLGVVGGPGPAYTPGSCTHVWNYEQTLAHLFPALERKMREMNLGPGLQSDGGVVNRITLRDSPWPDGMQYSREGPASDGHASTLSKSYREWRLSANDAWLKSQYPAVKKAMDYWIKRWDGHEEGVARGRQGNTYDGGIVGPNTFIGSQYLAALRAAEEMAKVCGDEESAKRWRIIFEKGSAAYTAECWDDEYKYFVQRIPKGEAAADYGNACFVDQVLGQWWALVNGLGYVLPKDKVDASLCAIWKWNMVGDMSLYTYHYGKPRVFIWGSGKGLMICTWPRGDYQHRPIMYSEEIWTGCEYHAAASMIWEGLVSEGLAVVKAIHERYTDGARNPWNEMECGDHYSRAMSSWSVLLALQGYSYVGPRGKLGFDPRLTPENHKSFFSAAEGWGSFSQQRDGNTQKNELEVAWGRLHLAELSLGIPPEAAHAKASVEFGQARVECQATAENGKIVIKFQPALDLTSGQVLRIGTLW